MEYLVEIKAKLKPGLLNPEANSVKRSLGLLGYKQVKDVDTEKAFVLTIEAKDEAEAKQLADSMCRRILVNPVIQDYIIKVK